MDIQDQVCTFDQAAAIYSYGVRIENATYWWYQNKNTGENAVFSPYEYLQDDDWVKVFPAPNVAELGVLLPDTITTEGKIRTLKSGFKGTCLYFHGLPFTKFEGKTEAQARAESYIWLLRKNYIIEKGIVLV